MSYYPKESTVYNIGLAPFLRYPRDRHERLKYANPGDFWSPCVPHTSQVGQVISVTLTVGETAVGSCFSI